MLITLIILHFLKNIQRLRAEDLILDLFFILIGEN